MALGSFFLSASASPLSASFSDEVSFDEFSFKDVSASDFSVSDLRVGALRVARRRRDLGLLSVSTFGSITSKPSGDDFDVSSSDFLSSDLLSSEVSVALSLPLSSF